EDVDRELGADAGHADELLEERLLARGQEAEEGERVLADVGVGEERGVRAGIAEAVESGERDGHTVADPAHVDHHLLRLLAEDPPAELGDQDGIPAVARVWAWQSAAARGSAASPASPSPGSSSIRATIKATWAFSARPKPVTCCFTVAGGKAWTGSPASAPASRTTPRTWPRTSAGRVFTAWKTSSTASTSGSRRAMSVATPSWMWRRRSWRE